MRLLMTADAVGGVWTYALDLARGLARRDVESVLAVQGAGPDEAQRRAAEALGAEVIATGLPLDWLATSPEEVEAAGWTLARLAEARACDLVQVNSPAYAAGAPFSQPVVGVQHSCTTTWWRAVRGAEPWPADFDWRRDLARRGLLACDRVVAPTAAFASAVQAAYDLPQAPICVWNGREPLATAPLAADVASEPYVFTAGRLWDESKGMDVLDSAAARLKAPVIAAGSLAAPGGAEARFAHLRTPGVLGQAELAARIAGAAVFVSPSVYEPFGLAVLEAAQAARPLVLADIASFRELWDGAAVFFPARDANALAEALAALLADAPRRAELGAAARDRARRYTVESMTDRMWAVFDSLVPQDQLQSSHESRLLHP